MGGKSGVDLRPCGSLWPVAAMDGYLEVEAAAAIRDGDGFGIRISDRNAASLLHARSGGRRTYEREDVWYLSCLSTMYLWVLGRGCLFLAGNFHVLAGNPAADIPFVSVLALERSHLYLQHRSSRRQE